MLRAWGFLLGGFPVDRGTLGIVGTRRRFLDFGVGVLHEIYHVQYLSVTSFSQP